MKRPPLLYGNGPPYTVEFNGRFNRSRILIGQRCESIIVAQRIQVHPIISLCRNGAIASNARHEKSAFSAMRQARVYSEVSGFTDEPGFERWFVYRAYRGCRRTNIARDGNIDPSHSRAFLNSGDPLRSGWRRGRMSRSRVRQVFRGINNINVCDDRFMWNFNLIINAMCLKTANESSELKIIVYTIHFWYNLSLIWFYNLRDWSRCYTHRVKKTL